MIWNIIRDFIVQYITGGTNSSNQVFITYLGRLYDNNGLGLGSGISSTNFSLYEISTYVGGNSQSAFISVSDWLATTLTIICMCLIVVFAIWLVRWVFKAVTSAFLLK